MPRTESGPAICNRSREWNPDDGHSPITKRDRLDARFLNSISKPPRKGKQTIGPATGIARSNLNPGESAFDPGKPQFDRYRFKTGHRLDYTDYRLPDYEERELGRLAVAERDTNTGAAVPAVCEGASCGGNANAKSTAKFGTASYEYLNRRARRPLNLVAATVLGAPLYFGRIAAAAIMKHKLFRPKKIEHDDGSVTVEHVLFVRHNGRLLKHIFPGWLFGQNYQYHRWNQAGGWFGQSYPRRWDQAASCYLDIRIDGKATNSTDLTWSQAAGRIGDEAFDNFSTRSPPPKQISFQHWGRTELARYNEHELDYFRHRKLEFMAGLVSASIRGITMPLPSLTVRSYTKTARRFFLTHRSQWGAERRRTGALSYS
jgi:hypothetical protein